MNNKGSDQDELALPICLPLSLTHLARETWELPGGQSTGLGPQAEGTGFVNGDPVRHFTGQTREEEERAG